ncbi:MAG TPA: 30S ribosomal protein S6 [Ktedonobacteraceae bacterium]|nr:30S ribosomal protein S6 [Ktedonobacteraceae bacterium]
MRRDYELAFILNPEVNEEEVRTFQDRIEQIVATYGGQIVKVNQWGRRRLAYPIERHRDGLYTFIDMILTPETVAELERMLKVSEIVLRHMVKRRDPKAVQKEREEREEREARAAAAASAAPAEEATAEGETTTEQAPEEATAPAETPVEDVPVLTEAETADVPPAIVEESIEA